MARPTHVGTARTGWSDSWIDETWPQERWSPGGPRRRRRLLLGGLTMAVLLAATAIVAAVTWPSDDVETALPVKTGPLVSIDQVFAPLPGYTFEDSLPSADAALRAQLEGQPEAKAITTDAGGRRVLQKGHTVAVASAVLFAEPVGVAQDAEARFLAAAQSGLASHEEATVAGRRGVWGQEPDGIDVLVVYKNRVGLVVGGPAGRSALEELTTKLLATIP